MITNINPETKIPYGYIAAAALDPEIVERLLFGAQARDLDFERYVDEVHEEVSIAAAENGVSLDDPGYEDWCEREFERRAEDYVGPDEVSVQGQYEGVTYATSWLGGALNFWIFESPFTTDKARRASPCVPGAAILDVLDGSEFGYDVPVDWRDEQ